MRFDVQNVKYTLIIDPRGKVDPCSADESMLLLTPREKRTIGSKQDSGPEEDDWISVLGPVVMKIFCCG
jgi:hypothetical protein